MFFLFYSSKGRWLYMLQTLGVGRWSDYRLLLSFVLFLSYTKH